MYNSVVEETEDSVAEPPLLPPAVAFEKSTALKSPSFARAEY